MLRIGGVGGGLIVLALTALAPSASAQQASGIAGLVRDTSGAVLPGVTVEAASPALIEKVRSVVTDGEGRYNIVDLRPGTYTVTFTLPGFSTFRREGIELTAGFTATVNADMRVGALEETVTVTGAEPARRHAERPAADGRLGRAARRRCRPARERWSALITLMPGNDGHGGRRRRLGHLHVEHARGATCTTARAASKFAVRRHADEQHGRAPVRPATW